jgi:ectoine hydroxylase-related dioxygenase (phytanoyl-CoA dioxygenase family)
LHRDYALTDAELRNGAEGSLSAGQVDEYDEQGYLVLPDLLDGHDLAPVRAAMTTKVDLIADQLLAAGLITDPLADEPFETRLARLFEGLTAEDFVTFTGQSWRDRLTGYFELMSNPKILDLIESLIGPEIFANPVYNVRPKVPRVAAGEVPWHQDKSYWPGARSNPVITVWVAVVDATVENGCLRVIPRTHHEAVAAFHFETYSGTAYRELDDAALARLRARARPVPVGAGSAIIFNDRFIHSSGPNASAHVRWSVDLRYQPADQDPMPQYGPGFLARSRAHAERVASLDDWRAGRPEADVEGT